MPYLVSEYSDLDDKQLSKIGPSLLSKAEHILELSQKEPKTIADIFNDDARLVISPSNRCNKGCAHCISDSTITGERMRYREFTDSMKNAGEDFLSIFKHADFGRRGDPMLYKDRGLPHTRGERDLSDLMGFLAEHDIKDQTIASGLAIQDRSKTIKNIADVKDEYDMHIESMITYHLYYPFDRDMIAKSMNRTLKEMSKYSDKIIISTIGDFYFPETCLQNAELQFFKDYYEIFNGFEHYERTDEKQFEFSGNAGEINVEFRTSNGIYPLGRFKELLRSSGYLEYYTEIFKEHTNTPIICPDVLEWPGLIIEPDGKVNTCGAYEGITCNHAVISNIFKESYEEFQGDMFMAYEIERQWILNNIDNLLQGKASTCKLLNQGYKQ